MEASVSEEARGARARDARIARRLALVAFLAYLPFFHGHFTGTDETGVFLTTRALYETGSFAVTEGPHRYRGADGRTYAHFAPGLSVLALPLYALGDLANEHLPAAWLARLAPRPVEEGRIDTYATPQIFAVALLAPLASAALVAVFFGCQRRLGASLRAAFVAAALLGGTTYVAAQSVYFLRHTAETVTLLAAFHAFLAYRQDGRLRDLVLGSGWAALTPLVAVPALVGLLPVALYGGFVLAERLRPAPLAVRARLLAAAAAPPLAALTTHVALNYALWGSFFDSPMVAQRARFSTPLAEGLAGFLLSPGASVFAYSPLLLLAPWWFPALWRTRRAECLVALAAPLAVLLFCARFELWPGLWSSPGPRYLFVAAPLWLLPLGPWLDTAPRPGRRVALFALAAVGAAVQLVLVLARWSGVIQHMGYQRRLAEAGFEFLFVAAESPIVGSWRVIQAGQVDAWVFDLARGAPGLAAVLLGFWALAFALASLALRRASRGD